MDAVTSRPLPGRPLALPNLLTYARIVAVPLVVACLFGESILSGGVWLRWVAVALFIAAALPAPDLRSIQGYGPLAS